MRVLRVVDLCTQNHFPCFLGAVTPKFISHLVEVVLQYINRLGLDIVAPSVLEGDDPCCIASRHALFQPLFSTALHRLRVA